MCERSLSLVAKAEVQACGGDTGEKKEKEKRMRTLRRKRSAEECSEGERRVSGLTVT